MELSVRNSRVYAYTGGKSFDAKLPCVMFVHGGEADHSVWGLQSRYLAHHGRAVLALDLPGHGRTEGPPLDTIEKMADWIVDVLVAAGASRTQIVGHSMGALVAIECAARHADRVDRIALLGAAYPMRVSAELLAATHADEHRARQMINIWSHSANAHYPSSPGPGFWVHGVNLRLMARQRPGVLPVDFAACNDYRGGMDAAAKVACPALFLIAQHDLMTPGRAVRDLVQAIPGARVIEIGGSGHAMMAEKPDEVLGALHNFLASAGTPA
jgi:pimeloyl-ACP methyl ester carboxylesterase